jgi:hypothetical protein
MNEGKLLESENNNAPVSASTVPGDPWLCVLGCAQREGGGKTLPIPGTPAYSDPSAEKSVPRWVYLPCKRDLQMFRRGQNNHKINGSNFTMYQSHITCEACVRNYISLGCFIMNLGR